METMIEVLTTGAGRRAFARALTLLAALTVGACAGTNAAGPAIEVEAPWARPALGPAEEHIGHERHEQHIQSGAHAEHDAHGADHAAMAGHHQHGGATSAVYLVLRNRGREGDRLIGARTDVARTVELHHSSIEDGIMRMRQVDAVEVPARGEARLEPGGYHIMLIGLVRGLEVGDRFEVTLEFEKSGARVVEVVVERRG